MTKTTNRARATAAVPTRTAKPVSRPAEGEAKTQNRNKTDARAAKAARAITEVSAAPRQGSKIDTLIGLMKSKSGAAIDDLARATGWQAHSVRGAISGTLKKKLGLKVLSERADGVRRYRIGK